jgi:enterochelin esterase-like enzyme
MNKFFLFAIAMLWTASSALAQGGQVFETRTLKSVTLNMERHYAIYLPQGYDKTDQSYPVLYLLHGSGDDQTGWVQFGQVEHIANKAIAEGQSAPMIIVMPDADAGVRGYFNNIQGTFRYEDFFFEELIPHIEKMYRVRTEKRYRAVAGLSMGGGGTIFYALHRPDMFSAAAPLSASTGMWGTFDEFKARFASTPDITDKQIEDYYKRQTITGILENATEEDVAKIKAVRWYASTGDDDGLTIGNNLMYNAFRAKGIPISYRVKEGAHKWTYWRMELPLVMGFVSKSFTLF